MYRFQQIILFIVIIQSLFWTAAKADVYVIIYATIDGKTGHAGIAIDNYDIVANDSLVDGKMITTYDSIPNGTVTYFDLWPKEDNMEMFRMGKDVDGLYYTLPNHQFPITLTLNTFYYQGIPKYDGLPADALVAINTLPAQDFDLENFIEQIIESAKPFNIRYFNCTDFVEISLEHLLNTELTPDEFIPFMYSSTPNQLYKELNKLNTAGTADIEILKDPGQKVSGSFFLERVIEGTTPN